MGNYDFLTKKLIRTFDWTDFGCDRYYEDEVVINGRDYIRSCVATSSTIVGNLYEVYDQSVKLNKYVLVVGEARQHPAELDITREGGIEIANVNSLMNPIMQIELDHEATWEEFESLAEWYVCHQIPKMTLTKEEIKNKGYDKKYPDDEEAFKSYSSN